MTSKRLLIAIGTVWGIAGLIEPHFPNPGEPANPVGIVQGLATALLLFSWCKVHAEEHAIKPPPGAPLLVAVFAPIGLSYYAFRGYGLRGGTRLVGLALVAVVVFMAIYLVCFEVSAWSVYFVLRALR
jgi:hypothetical protein